MNKKTRLASLVMTSSCLLTLALTAALSNSNLAFAEDPSPVVVNATINTQDVVQKIDPKIYSQFLEHIYNSCNGGLWGELVWNRWKPVRTMDGPLRTEY